MLEGKLAHATLDNNLLRKANINMQTEDGQRVKLFTRAIADLNKKLRDVKEYYEGEGKKYFSAS